MFYVMLLRLKRSTVVFTGRLKRGNKAPNSEESRDGKKHKISAMKDTYISPRHLRVGRCHVTKSLLELVIV